MAYKEEAKEILELVGGKENIVNLTHCLTRLRFQLKDTSSVDDKDLKDKDYVLGLVDTGKEYQVIIGTDVENYHRAIQDVIEGNKTKQKKNLKEIGLTFVDTVSGIFNPIIPALTAAGMLQAVLAVAKTFGWLSVDSQTFKILSFMGNTTFYFLPILLANSAAKKFKTNAYVAMMLGGILIHPDFIAMVGLSKETTEAISLFGIPVYNAVYTSSVIPIILGVYAMSKIEPIADRISPKQLKFFLRPLITILVTGVLTLTILGPAGYIASTWITNGVQYLDNIAGWIVPTLIGAILPLLVMTGVHHGLTAVGINNRLTIGYDAMIYPGQLASNVAQGAAGFAVSLKAKNSQIKQIAAATSLTAMCGITEPILFGLTVRVKTNLIATMIGGAVAGFFFGMFGVKNFSGGAPGLLTLPSYIGLEAGMSNFYLAIVGTVIGAIVSFVIAYVLYKDERYADDEKESAESNISKDSGISNESIYKPVDGKSVPLQEVNDATFAEEMMGKGIAFIPENGRVYSPVNGRIESIFPTKHALIIVSDLGAQVILHIGLDTVKLNGEYFDVKVKEGDIIEKGDLLVTYDYEAIKEQGYDLITPMVLLNTDKYTSIVPNTSASSLNDVAIELIK